MVLCKSEEVHQDEVAAGRFLPLGFLRGQSRLVGRAAAAARRIKVDDRPLSQGRQGFGSFSVWNANDPSSRLT